VEPTVLTKTLTKTCSVPRRQPYRDPWATITPTMLYAAALETASTPTSSPTSTSTTTRRRRDNARPAFDDRAAFLAARSARLANSNVIEKRGLDNSTVTITEPQTTKWQTSTAWTTAAPSTMIVTVERVTTVTAVSTTTKYRGVTQVISTITAVSRLCPSMLDPASLTLLVSSPRLPRQRRSTPSSAPLPPSRGVRL